MSPETAWKPPGRLVLLCLGHWKTPRPKASFAPAPGKHGGCHRLLKLSNLPGEGDSGQRSALWGLAQSPGSQELVAGLQQTGSPVAAVAAPPPALLRSEKAQVLWLCSSSLRKGVGFPGFPGRGNAHSEPRAVPGHTRRFGRLIKCVFGK